MAATSHKKAIGTRAKSSYDRQIADKTVGEIRTFLAEIANGTRRYLTVDNLTEQIELQYHGRFAVELLQNAIDANRKPGRTNPGRVHFLLDRTEGSNGTLYVANDGQSFTAKNMRALANLGQSTKDPRESIGSKGIGFCSILEISSSPEIYSCAETTRGVFNGYCFRFARDILETADEIMREIQSGQDEVIWSLGGEPYRITNFFAEEIRARCAEEEIDLVHELHLLSPYSLPIPAEPTGKHMKYFAGNGYATLVRLPFKSPGALDTAIEKLGELNEDTLVFLDGLGTLAINDGKSVRTFSRRTRHRSKLDCDEISIRGDKTTRSYWLWTKVLRDREALAEATARLPGQWKKLTEAPLSIAVPLDRRCEGRFYTYFPTNKSTETGALINAPFYAEMSRKTLDVEIELNALLLRELTDHLITITRDILAGKGKPEASALVELLATTTSAAPSWSPRLYTALGDRALILTNLGWERPPHVKVLRGASGGLRVFTPDRMRKCKQFPIADATLEENHRRRLESLLRCFNSNGSIHPAEAEYAAIAEVIAADFHGSWDEYWQDLEQIIPARASPALERRKVLLDDQGALRAARSPDGVQIFFSPVHESALARIRIPDVLRKRMVFMDPVVTARAETRSYLAKMVGNFSVVEIFKKVLIPALPSEEVQPGGPAVAICADVLDLVVQLASHTPNVAAIMRQDLRQLRLPCEGGWHPAEECVFGSGWEKPCGVLMDSYLHGLADSQGAVLRGRLLRTPEAPEWRDRATWLRRHLADLGVRDGLFPSPVSTLSLVFWMTYNRPHGPPETPEGASPATWCAYWESTRIGIRCDFKGPFEYRLNDVSLITGLDSGAKTSEQCRALSGLLLRTIPDWPPGWRKSRLSKIGGIGYSEDCMSYLWYLLQEKAWIWGPGDESGARPSERWFVPGAPTPEQLRNLGHLKLLSPEIRELVQASSAVRQVLVELGMPVYDLQNRSSDPRLLAALVEAWEDKRVTSAMRTNFTGQVRDAWHVFHPQDPSKLPTAFIVETGAWAITVLRPTADNPVFLPDDKFNQDLSAMEGLPIVVMQTSDADRLVPLYQRKLPSAVRALSTLRVEVLSGDSPWRPSERARGLLSSPMHWLIPFALAISAFTGDGAHGTSNEEFRSKLTRLRNVQIDDVARLGLRITGYDRLVGPRPAAATWDASSRALLYDSEKERWLEALAGPLAQLLGRAELVMPLRLALSKMEQTEVQSDEGMRPALAAVMISVSQFAEVRQHCIGDHAWICDRLRPVLALLAPHAARDQLNRAENDEELAALLTGLLPVGVPVAELLALARKQPDDYAMGLAIFELIKALAELNAWNEALTRIGPPYTCVANPEAHAQFKTHCQAARTTVRAVVRRMCRLDPELSYRTLVQALDSPTPPPNLATEHWRVPFRVAVLALVEKLDLGPLSEAVRDALTRSDTREELVAALTRADPSIEPTCDPIELHADNVEACRRVCGDLQLIAIAWCTRVKAPIGRFGDGIPSLLAPLKLRLDRGEGFLERWTDERILKSLASVLPRETAHAELLAAIAQSEAIVLVREKLALSDEELSAAAELAQVAEQKRRQARRTHDVCGRPFEVGPDKLGALWEHLDRCLKDDQLPVIDPLQMARLSGEWGERSRKRGGGRGSSQIPRRPSPELVDVIGLTGEVFAYRMLKRRFGDGAVSPSAWISKYSQHRFPDNDVNDSAGYDFRVVDADVTWLIEVKSTTGDEPTFELGLSEVRTASDLAEGQRFCVLHIQRVLSTAPRARFLPNPFSPEGEGCYRLERSGMYVGYKLAE